MATRLQNPDPRPLYQQVKHLFIERIKEGDWKPGSILPSEQQLAAELGVSQGTVRKALDFMTDENLLVRRQGKGTYVAEHDQERILFQYFKLTSDSGERRMPDSRDATIVALKADAELASLLGIKRNSALWKIERLRYLDDNPIIIEVIYIPQKLLPQGDQMGSIPNNLYQLYAKSNGGTVARAIEKIKAINADSDLAEKVGKQGGQAMLSIERIALGLDGKPLELRRSYCLTDNFHYLSDLT